MRIGKFAKVNQVSIDTIRHYIDLGLIVPEKSGGQYVFDDRCQKSFEEILSLKEMGFTLHEIKTIFLYKSLGNLTHYQQDEYYKALFTNKYEGILKEIDQLTAMAEKLKEKLTTLSHNSTGERRPIGVDINVLNLFKCVHCHGDLSIQNGVIQDNQIMSGQLQCHCGATYPIENGILTVSTYQYEHSATFDQSYIRDYINLTDFHYLDNIYKSLQWVKKRVDLSHFKQKVILELGSGVGFLLRNLYHELPEDMIYIAVDHQMSRHTFLKAMLETTELRRRVIFVCADFLQVPLKDHTVDILLDFSGTSNYSFEHSEFLLEATDHYMKENGILIGTYILFKNFSANSLIKPAYRKNFTQSYVQERINALGYQPLGQSVSDPVEHGGTYESYFVKGEKVYHYLFYGKR